MFLKGKEVIIINMIGIRTYCMFPMHWEHFIRLFVYQFIT